MHTLYKQIEQTIRKHQPQLKIGNNISEPDVRHAIRNVMRDNPDIIWFSHQWMYNEKEHKVFFRYAMDQNRCKKAQEQIEDVVLNDFKIESVKAFSPIAQVMYVYKWIALYCRYNIHSAHNQTIYSVFVYRNSVCTGIAKAAQYLLKQLGIESKLVFGKMNNSDTGSRHCWLIVQLNDQWFHLDPTFAIPETGYLLSESGVEPITGHDLLNYNYFCTDTDTIKLSRTIEYEESLPWCANNIDYTLYQDIQVYPSRHGQSRGLGCLLSDTGTTADIYLAHVSLGIQSVAKVFRNDPNHDLLRKELRIMRVCAWQHLLRATNADFDNGILYIEQATPLSELLASHYFKLTVEGFCLLLLDIIAGLKELQYHGIVYRDIHLKNIYLSETLTNGQNIYKLGDFGSCSFLGDEKNIKKSADIGGVGSKWYMAPETCKEGIFDERSAVYAVGMVAYYLLNELYPPLWFELGAMSNAFRLSGMQLPLPCKLERPEYKHLNMAFLKKAISHAPSDRYDSLNALEKAIHECINKNPKYRNMVIVQGADADSHSSELKQESIDFCSTCANFSSIDFSNYEDVNINAESDGNTALHTKGKSTSTSSNDCSSRINDFACTCGSAFDSKEKNTSFSPKTNQHRNVYKEQAPKSAKRFLGIFDWFRGKQNHNEKNKQNIPSSVNSSVYAPSEAKRDDYMMIQVFLYKDGEEDFIRDKATEVDSSAQRRNYTPLNFKLMSGDVVKVSLTANVSGVEIAEPTQTLIWDGRCTDCQFGIFISKEYKASSLLSTVTLTVNGAPAGRMMFKTAIVNQPRNLYAEINCKTFHKIFISYSHKDEQRVKYIAEAYRAQGVDYFFDRHYLKGGDVYPMKIREYIKSADLFILCWSKNAAESEYVSLERCQALALAYPQIDIEKATLTIHPISIEPHAEYPEDMSKWYNFEEV